MKWLRPLWFPTDLLSVCGIVLGSIAVSRQYLLACCGGLLEASLGGPLGASGRAPGADFGPLDGPWSPWAAPGPVPGRLWALLGGLGAPLGRSWRLLAAPGPLLGRPGALLAAPGRPLGPFWRLLGGSWSPLGGSKVALCRKARIRRQYGVFRGFLGLRELAWRLLRPSWGSLAWVPPISPSKRCLGDHSCIKTKPCQL